MKRVFLTLALAAFAFAANAQIVVGGNLGFQTVSTKHAFDGKTYADKLSANKFGIDLRAGYQINDKMQAGLMLGYTLTNSKTQTPDPANLEDELGYAKTHTNMFNVTPYFRYNCFEFGSNFTFFAEAQLGLGFGGSYTETQPTPGKVDGPKEFMFGLGVVPGINYRVSDKVSFDLYLNFIGIGYSMDKLTYDVDGKDDVYTNGGFGFDFHTSGMSIDDLTSAITVGFNYHF